MAKDYKKIYEEQVFERNIKTLINRLGQYNCIKPDGNLDEVFMLSYLVRNSKPTAEAYKKLNTAFEELKKNKAFEDFNPLVKESTLKNIEFYGDYLVRPAKSEVNSRFDNIFIGTIIKLPKKSASDYFPGEAWKASLEDPFKVGDKILYICKSNIILDFECLHLVTWFTGKILNHNNNVQ
jgi:hypothetical protein